VIARVLARSGVARVAEVGPGDDAAVLRAPDGRVVATTDVLVEGRHFRRDWSSAEDVGHKAAAANLADVAAMGGVTTALLVGLACPPDTPTTWLEGVGRRPGRRVRAAGSGRRRRGHGGGRTGSGAVVLSVTALGDLEGRAPVLRSGARAGDVVALAGRLGWSACGLAVLRRGFSSPLAAVSAHRRPAPPYAAGPAAADAGATAMCDVSDGLLADAGHLARASGVDVDLDRAALVRTCLEPAGRCSRWAPRWGRPAGVGAHRRGGPRAPGHLPGRRDLPEGWTPSAVRAGEPGVFVAGSGGASRSAWGRGGPGMSTSAEPCGAARRRCCARCPTTTRFARARRPGPAGVRRRYGGRTARRWSR
jgi:thiamine-monophosphate kinase